MNDLKSKLQEFGLSEKEANVYLAMLELGPSSAQDIAKKAGVNRATTYVMLESLKRRGLMSSVERGKKILYAAESPEHLLTIVESEVRVVREKKMRLEGAMPEFLGLFNAIEDKPKVRFFEGEEGLRACREAVAELGSKQAGRILIHFDEVTLQTVKTDEDHRIRLANKLLPVRLLYSIDPNLELPVFARNTQARKLPQEMLAFKGELYIYDTFLLVGATKTRPIGVIIESGEVVTIFQSLFEFIWKQVASDK